MNSFTFYKNYYELIKYLNEEDRLALYDAIFKYMFDDEEPTFNNLKNGIWINLKMPLNTSKKQYFNGIKGGRPKKEKENPKKTQIETQPKTQKKTNNNFLFLISNFLFLKDRGLLRGKIEEWLEYKKQRGDKPYTEIGFKKLLTQIENNVNKYGEDKVMSLMDECMGSNYQGIIFDRLKNNRLQIKEQTPEWFNKEIKNEPLTEEEKEEFDDLLESLQEDISKIRG